ncbi:MAG: hypothetical protein QME74_00985 [Candidatus Edwardsbacteria bacterium]|nr:hypothetical protein [Candidatus Edwardsbacteria bacterium]
MKKVITTVGTSIFTNCLKQCDDIRPHYESLEKTPGGEWDRHRDRIEKLRPAVLKWAAGKPQASAEMKSIGAIAGQLNEPLDVYLIATDTVLSRLAAEMVKALLNADSTGLISAQFDERKDRIQGLQVDDAAAFCRTGLVNLIQRFEDICGGYYADTIFNITGGYKGVIPHITIFAQANNAPLCYIFEDTDTLITIPQTPVDISWGLFEKYEDKIEELSRGLAGMGWDDFRRKNGIGDDFPDIVWRDDKLGLLELNAIGQYFYRRYQRWILVYVLAGGPFSSDHAHRQRTRLNRAIEGLHAGLHGFIRDNQLSDKPGEEVLAALHERGGANLNHATPQASAYFIYKYPSSAEEIRLLYGFEWENGGLRRLTVYDYRAGEFKHATYPEEFRSFFLNNRDKQTVPYLQSSYK